MNRWNLTSVSKALWRILNIEIKFPSRESTNVQVEATRISRRLGDALHKLRNQEAALRRGIQDSMRRNTANRMLSFSAKLSSVTRTIKIVESLGVSRPPEVQVFAFSSAMLQESFRRCVEMPEEGMHFIAGIEVEGILVGTQIVPFPYEFRSFVGAAGVHEATHKICIEAHESGQKIIAIAHSHPGSGIGANYPSGIDRKTQSLWEHGRSIVGGIFSRDGYLRWYSNNVAFEINVMGNQIKRIDRDVWKLETENANL